MNKELLVIREMKKGEEKELAKTGRKAFVDPDYHGCSCSARLPKASLFL